ncbi:MAG: hypothetical protein Kow0090_09320 [Myxococcota bacterium]
MKAMAKMKKVSIGVCMPIILVSFLLLSCGDDAASDGKSAYAEVTGGISNDVDALASLRDVEIPPHFRFQTTREVALKIEIDPPALGKSYIAFIKIRTSDDKVVYKGAVKEDGMTLRLPIPLSEGALLISVETLSEEYEEEVAIYRDGSALLALR